MPPFVPPKHFNISPVQVLLGIGDDQAKHLDALAHQLKDKAEATYQRGRSAAY